MGGLDGRKGGREGGVFALLCFALNTARLARSRREREKPLCLSFSEGGVGRVEDSGTAGQRDEGRGRRVEQRRGEERRGDVVCL